MNTCDSCLYWRHLGDSHASRHVHYDSRYVTVPAGPEGLCRALPPATDSRWPMTGGGDWCGCWKSSEARLAELLTEATTPLTSAAGETPELPDPDSAGNSAPAEGGKGPPPVELAAPSDAGGPPSLLQRVFRRGHGEGRRQQ